MAGKRAFRFSWVYQLILVLLLTPLFVLYLTVNWAARLVFFVTDIFKSRKKPITSRHTIRQAKNTVFNMPANEKKKTTEGLTYISSEPIVIRSSHNTDGQL